MLSHSPFPRYGVAFKAQRSPGIFSWVRIHEHTTKQGYWVPDEDSPDRPQDSCQELSMGYLRGWFISWKLKAQRLKATLKNWGHPGNRREIFDKVQG